jgi:ureidoacrylate peracid hydrolase
MHRYQALFQPILMQFLQAHDIKTLVITGLATNVCVESTIRDGFMWATQ